MRENSGALGMFSIFISAVGTWVYMNGKTQ